MSHEEMRTLSELVEMDLGCVVVCCRWDHQPGESRHLIHLDSCVMSFTGTRRPPAAQVRHPGSVMETLCSVEVRGWF